MQALITSAKRIVKAHSPLPFSVYSSGQEQHILNVPVNKPLLVCVLNGHKQLGSQGATHCPAGSFVFLSNRPGIDMRNIPAGAEYFALLLEFEQEDFDDFTGRRASARTHLQGPLQPLLTDALRQLIEWSAYAPSELWGLRRREILHTLHHLGHRELAALAAPPSLGYRVQCLIGSRMAEEVGMPFVSAALAMSESTLRRKLAHEGTSLQAIKDRVKLGHGLHLVQTTASPIGLIAEQCGYHSQSRFTDKFKSLFGITPTELRKTRMIETGE